MEKYLIETITNGEAVTFLREHRAQKEQISISDADKWLGAFADRKLVAVCGLQRIGKTVRVKGFFTDTDYRRQGIGQALLHKATNSPEEMTAFATERSCRLFEGAGFQTEKALKNNIKFMRRKRS